MSADDFLWLVTQAVFLAVFLDVSVKAVRRRQLAQADIALFFGAILAIIVVSDVERLLEIPNHPGLQSASYVAVSALPYLALRVVDDFAPQPGWLMRLTGVGLGLLVVGALFVPQPWPLWFQIVPVLWFVVIGGDASLEFRRHAGRTSGVTERRMVAAATGSALVGVTFVLAVVALLVPISAQPIAVANRVLALCAGIACFLGFSPPSVLRRAWQEPELRAFLVRAASLPRLPDVHAIVHALERGAAAATGAPNASIGLWDAERGRMVYSDRQGEPWVSPSADMLGDRAFIRQSPHLLGQSESR